MPARSPLAPQSPAHDLIEPEGVDALLCHRSFQAMNTNVQVFIREGGFAPLLAAAQEAFQREEARLSRFRPDSELSRFNARTTDRFPVSPEMLRVIELAQRFCRLTQGLFEPAVLANLEAAGYDRSFELIAAAADTPTGARLAEARGSVLDLRLGPSDLTVEGPPGLRIDLGGIGKGYTVDRTAEVLARARDFLVNAGGDIYASGRGPDGDGWLVAIADHFDPAVDIAQLWLRDEALATSTVAVRRWQRAGRWQNHLIDPRTGAPVDSGSVSVSVIARTAVEADVFAKTALLLGPDEGRRFLESRRLPGLFALSDGRVRATRDWPE